METWFSKKIETKYIFRNNSGNKFLYIVFTLAALWLTFFICWNFCLCFSIFLFQNILRTICAYWCVLHAFWNENIHAGWDLNSCRFLFLDGASMHAHLRQAACVASAQHAMREKILRGYIFSNKAEDAECFDRDEMGNYVVGIHVLIWRCDILIWRCDVLIWRCYILIWRLDILI